MSDFNLQANSQKIPLQMEEENLVAAIALRIRQSLDLDVILHQTVEEVRQFLATDRVIVYCFEPDWSGLIVVESVISPWKKVFGSKIKDPCFSENYIQQYKQGRIQAVEDIYTAKLTPCHRNLLAEFEVRANLVLPIVAEDKLWGLLVAQHCQCPRKWQSSEIELLKQLSTQVGIAVQQAELYEKIESLNAYLEQKVAKRTTKLQRSLQFESLVRSVTEKVRDTLDEEQILQTVARELGQLLKIERCKIELYSKDCSIATVAYEYAKSDLICQGRTRQVAQFPELYQQLLKKESLQFVERIPKLSPRKTQVTRLVCPIFDNRGILGNLWLIRPKEELFERFEIRLVEQVASQCAIAMRQARLYEKAQLQVKELAKLNALKDDFLKTISHELKAPMSSIRLASETLEILLEQEIGTKRSVTFTKVLDIFHSACERQNQLVDDLLTLCYIDAKKEILSFKWLDLAIWIPQIARPFCKRIESQQQQLVIDIAAELPPLKTDLSAFKRILTELINNACKYTPAGETISISALLKENKIQIIVSNSGVEIPSLEQERVFDKFYRILSHDPWQYGGTGIGLALVKKLVELLEGTIQLESQSGQTTFTLQFPRHN